MAFLALPACRSINTEPGLAAMAARKGWRYGAAVQSSQLDDPAFAAAILHETGLLVPEGELKWDVLRPAPERFDFTGYRKIAAFACRHGVALRGHTLVWHRANPVWLDTALREATGQAGRRRAETLLTDHIQRVVAETRPVIHAWDVVNEAVHPDSPRADGLRETPWLRALGPDYIALAFRTAASAAPEIELVYNEYGMEYDDPQSRARRAHILALLERLKRADVPVHALGLQSHLQCHRPLAGADFVTFLRDVRDLGLAVRVTELDLYTGHLTGTLDERRMLASYYLRTWLDTTQQAGPVDTMLTWGLSERASWLNAFYQNDVAALPLDSAFRHTVIWDTLRDHWALHR